MPLQKRLMRRVFSQLEVSVSLGQQHGRVVLGSLGYGIQDPAKSQDASAIRLLKESDKTGEFRDGWPLARFETDAHGRPVSNYGTMRITPAATLGLAVAAHSAATIRLRELIRSTQVGDNTLA
jgi:hypothetical protein